MAGTFPGIANAQQQDINGGPMSGCQCAVYSGSAYAALFSDIGLTVSIANPVIGDQSGRLPMFFVADGIYRVRLIDSTGQTSNGGFDYPQVPSIGPSSGGGGGGGVDPTTIATTGDIKPRLSSDTVTGWVRINGRTIGSATSGATERANADTASLYTYIWSNFGDTICPVSTGRGANAAADFAANKTITLFDLRGRTLSGFDDMGGASAARLTAGLFGTGNGTTVGSSGGESRHTLGISEIPVHTHAIADHNHALHYTNNAVIGAIGGSFTVPSNPSNPFGPANPTSIGTTDNASLSPANMGGGGSHNNLQPFAVCNWLWKL